jgi:predicted transcriptional regulator YdeE
MEKIIVEYPGVKLVGIVTEMTNNAAEAGSCDGKIFPVVKQYFHGGMAEKIAHRKKPGTTYCAFTAYDPLYTNENNYKGDYSYFIGEEVLSFDDVPEGFVTLTIPAQAYVKFTNGPGAMPNVLMDVWKRIWGSTQEELGGKRTYKVDFEMYDERANDHQNIVLDVFVGVEK